MRKIVRVAAGLGWTALLVAAASAPSSGCGSKGSAATGGSDGGSTTSEGGGGQPVVQPDAGPDTGPMGDAAVDAPVDAPGVVCPTSAPADFSDPAVAFMCSRFVYLAGGDDTTIIQSLDEGATWTTQQFDNVTGDDYINNLAVYLGIINTTTLPGVFQSADQGTTFTVVATLPHSNFDTYGGQLNVGDKGLLLTDNAGTYSSVDGVTWTTLTPFPGMPSADGFGGHWSGTAFGAGIYVALQDKSAFHTWDGTTFTDGTLPITTGNGQLVAFGNGVFVAVGGGQSATSTDGKTWGNVSPIQAAGDGGGTASPATLLFDGNTFLGYDNEKLAFSTDGKTWTIMSLGTTRIETAANSEGRFVAAGAIGNTKGILRSSDGLDWTMVHPFAAGETANINGWRVGVGRVLK
jgi:hypothetical protein